MNASVLFPVGSPVASEDIIDREDYIRDLQTRLKDGKHLWVVGPRRIGKTSVVNHVLRQLREQGFLVASVDIFRIASLREFVEYYADACLENESGVRKTVRALQELGGRLTPKLTYSIGQSEMELAVALKRKQMSDMQLLSQVLDLAETIAKRRERRLIVALDEFQDVEKLGGSALLKSLRSHLQQQEHVTYVFLGSLQTWMRDVFGVRENEPFYRFASEQPLPAIPPDALAEYVTRKFGEKGINIDSALAGIICDYTGCHPMDTMQLCSELHYLLLQFRTTEATPALAQAAYEQCLASLERVFSDEWLQLRRRKHDQTIVKLIANGQLPFAVSGASNQATSQSLKRLVDSGILERERHGTYRFTEAMFAEYVRRL